MPWIIYDKTGAIKGRCTNKPGDGNMIPDGLGGMMPEVQIWMEDDTVETLAFINRPLPQAVDKIAALEARIAELESKARL